MGELGQDIYLRELEIQLTLVFSQIRFFWQLNHKYLRQYARRKVRVRYII